MIKHRLTVKSVHELVIILRTGSRDALCFILSGGGGGGRRKGRGEEGRGAGGEDDGRVTRLTDERIKSMPTPGDSLHARTICPGSWKSRKSRESSGCLNQEINDIPKDLIFFQFSSRWFVKAPKVPPKMHVYVCVVAVVVLFLFFFSRRI